MNCYGDVECEDTVTLKGLTLTSTQSHGKKLNSDITNIHIVVVMGRNCLLFKKK